MPEESGAEPQELLEQIEHGKHRAEHHEPGEDDAKLAFTMRAAVSASILAVMAALASLLSGHAANEAILKQSEASDKWSYYQAKSTKSHLFEGNKYVVAAIAGMVGKRQSEPVEKALKDFDDKISRYDREKNEIQKEAALLEAASAYEFNRHHNLSLAVACFQIGIVLSSVAIMVRAHWLFYGSIAGGAIGVVFVVLGVIGSKSVLP